MPLVHWISPLFLHRHMNLFHLQHPPFPFSSCPNIRFIHTYIHSYACCSYPNKNEMWHVGDMCVCVVYHLYLAIWTTTVHIVAFFFTSIVYVYRMRNTLSFNSLFCRTWSAFVFCAPCFFLLRCAILIICINLGGRYWHLCDFGKCMVLRTPNGLSELRWGGSRGFSWKLSFSIQWQIISFCMCVYVVLSFDWYIHGICNYGVFGGG